MDFNAIMQQAQKMQEEMEKQEKLLKEKEYTNTTSTSIVKVTMNGDCELLAVKINEDFVNNFTKDDVEILQDAICVAVTDVTTQIKNDQMDMVGGVANDISFPGMR